MEAGRPGHDSFSWFPPSVPPFPLLNSLTAWGKDDFLETKKVWLHCIVQYNKALETSKCPAGDEVQVILLRRGTEDEPAGAYHQDQHEILQETKPQVGPSICLRMAFGNICINKVPLCLQNFTYIPKMDYQSDAISFFLILDTTDQTLRCKIGNLPGTFTATPVFQITLKLQPMCFFFFLETIKMMQSPAFKKVCNSCSKQQHFSEQF